MAKPLMFLLCVLILIAADCTKGEVDLSAQATFVSSAGNPAPTLLVTPAFLRPTAAFATPGAEGVSLGPPTATPTSTPTRTRVPSTPTSTRRPTATFTPRPPTATFTPRPPTATFTPTPVPWPLTFNWIDKGRAFDENECTWRNGTHIRGLIRRSDGTVVSGRQNTAIMHLWISSDDRGLFAYPGLYRDFPEWNDGNWDADFPRRRSEEH